MTTGIIIGLTIGFVFILFIAFSLLRNSATDKQVDKNMREKQQRRRDLKGGEE